MDNQLIMKEYGRYRFARRLEGAGHAAKNIFQDLFVGAVIFAAIGGLGWILMIITGIANGERPVDTRSNLTVALALAESYRDLSNEQIVERDREADARALARESGLDAPRQVWFSAEDRTLSVPVTENQCSVLRETHPAITNDENNLKARGAVSCGGSSLTVKVRDTKGDNS